MDADVWKPGRGRMTLGTETWVIGANEHRGWVAPRNGEADTPVVPATRERSLDQRGSADLDCPTVSAASDACGSAPVCSPFASSRRCSKEAVASEAAPASVLVLRDVPEQPCGRRFRRVVSSAKLLSFCKNVLGFIRPVRIDVNAILDAQEAGNSILTDVGRVPLLPGSLSFCA